MSLFYVFIPLGNIIEEVRRYEDKRKIAVKTDRKNKPCTPYLRPKTKDLEVKTMRQCTKCKVTKEYSVKDVIRFTTLGQDLKNSMKKHHPWKNTSPKVKVGNKNQRKVPILKMTSK